MKKIIILLLLLFTSNFFTAIFSAENKNIKVALILWRGETEAERGFKNKLSELGYSVDYSIFNAEQDISNLARYLRSDFNFSEYDYIYTFGTTVSKMVKKLNSSGTPQVFNIVNSPVTSEIIDNSNKHSENIAGVSNHVSLISQITNAKKVINFKKLGVFFNAKELNSEITIKNLKEISRVLNFELVLFRTAPTTNVLKNRLNDILENKYNIDAIFLPADSYIISNSQIISDTLLKAKIPSIGAVEEYINNGILVGTTTNYYYLGELSAEIINKHENGISLNVIPVFYDENPLFIINKSTLTTLEFNINNEIIDRVIIR